MSLISFPPVEDNLVSVGGDDFLCKPIDKNELELVLTKYLDLIPV